MDLNASGFSDFPFFNNSWEIVMESVLCSLICLLHVDQEFFLEAVLADEAVKTGNAHFADSASVCLVQKGLRSVTAADGMSSVVVKEIQCRDDCEVSRAKKTIVRLFYAKNKTLVLDVPLHPTSLGVEATSKTHGRRAAVAATCF